VRSIHRRLPAIGVHQRESGDYRHAVVWNDAFPPGVGSSIPVRPSGQTTELSVQLVAVVVVFDHSRHASFRRRTTLELHRINDLLPVGLPSIRRRRIG
jgi:hypothetical protein